MEKRDFSDSYHQIKVRMKSPNENRTTFGTLAFTRAPRRLRGTDIPQYELNNTILGDLIRAGEVCKIADYPHFGSDTVQKPLSTLQDIVSRCEKANLRVQPAKEKFHKHKHKHKPDPSSRVKKPITGTGLRSPLGGIQGHPPSPNFRRKLPSTLRLQKPVMVYTDRPPPLLLGLTQRQVI